MALILGIVLSFVVLNLGGCMIPSRFEKRVRRGPEEYGPLY